MIQAQRIVQTAASKTAMNAYFGRKYGEVLADVMTEQSTAFFVDKHVNGDWGSISDEDAEQNEFDLKHGGRAMSVFPLGERKLWVISDGVEPRGSDGNNAAYSTTVLLPEDY